MIEIETPRLILRRFRIQDAAAMADCGDGFDAAGGALQVAEGSLGRPAAREGDLVPGAAYGAPTRDRGNRWGESGPADPTPSPWPGRCLPGR
ncbi:hypothetical protein [Streptomyces sp. cg2]|uniref:hypothetical protein n=1 Tax=Streptomyces sp. cg2 TaxID=3238799 RepID=UPI0034E2ACF1